MYPTWYPPGNSHKPKQSRLLTIETLQPGTSHWQHSVDGKYPHPITWRSSWQVGWPTSPVFLSFPWGHRHSPQGKEWFTGRLLSPILPNRVGGEGETLILHKGPRTSFHSWGSKHLFRSLFSNFAPLLSKRCDWWGRGEISITGPHHHLVGSVAKWKALFSLYVPG